MYFSKGSISHLYLKKLNNHLFKKSKYIPLNGHNYKVKGARGFNTTTRELKYFDNNATQSRDLFTKPASKIGREVVVE